MRRWLVRLRQTILHPEVGHRNRRALGQKDGPLRTVEQVLNVMMETTDVGIRADQRALLMSKLKRGQLFENSPRVKEALVIWEEALKQASALVEENREHVSQEAAKIDAEGKSAGKKDAAAADVDGEEQDE
jgi:E3 ubiquitin-protein ligase SHPRH